MISWVGSADDPRLEPYRYVASPAWLRERNLFVAEGRLVVARLIARETFAIQSVLVNGAAHDALLEPLSSLDANVYVCADDMLSRITGYNFHRGCLALVERPAPLAVAALEGARRLLALEGVGNPDNVGGLFRTAAAFGVDGILLNAASGDPLYRKAIRTSMGAALRVPYVRVEDRWLEQLERFRGRGFSLVALTPQADAITVDELSRALDPRDRVMLMVGAEGPGLDATTIARADLRVRIPVDPAVDSLNVVVAAGIALSRISLRA